MNALFLSLCLLAAPVNEPGQAPPVRNTVCGCKSCDCKDCDCPSCKDCEGCAKTRRFVVYDVGTKRCLPCLRFRPLFEAWSNRYRKVADFKVIDADDNTEIPRKFGVTSYPTVIVTDGSKHVVFVGAPTQEQIENALGLKVKLSYSESVKRVLAGETVVLAIRESRRTLNGLAVYECTDPPKGVKGHYRCYLQDGKAVWEEVK